jgi:hypothetical protein
MVLLILFVEMVRTGFVGVAAGATAPGTAGQQIVFTAPRATGATVLVFALYWRPRNFWLWNVTKLFNIYNVNKYEV